VAEVATRDRDAERSGGVDGDVARVALEHERADVDVRGEGERERIAGEKTRDDRVHACQHEPSTALEVKGQTVAG
jgi:hypothetical protein